MDKWRLIVDPDLPGAENMARDELLATGMESGEREMPVFRLYGWSEPTISIGYVQDPASLGGAGLPVVRRITGGRAVIHDDEITYSVTAPSAHPLFNGGIAATYNIISGCIVAALKEIGITASLSRSKRHAGKGQSDACFHTPSRSEVLAGGRKLVGSSQRRFKRSFLQHGSILLSIDPVAHERVFGPGVVERMASVAEFSRAGRDALRTALIESFFSRLGASFKEDAFSEGELEAAGLLMARRYSAPEWNASGGRARPRASQPR